MSRIWKTSGALLALAAVCAAQQSPRKTQSTATMPGASGRIPAERAILTDESLFDTLFLLIGVWAEPTGLMKQEADKDRKKYNEYVRGKIQEKTRVSDKEADFLREMGSSCRTQLLDIQAKHTEHMKKMTDFYQQGQTVFAEAEKKEKQLAADRDFTLKDCIRRVRFNLGDQKFEQLRFILDGSIGPMLRPKAPMITVTPGKAR